MKPAMVVPTIKTTVNLIKFSKAWVNRVFRFFYGSANPIGHRDAHRPSNHAVDENCDSSY